MSDLDRMESDIADHDERLRALEEERERGSNAIFDLCDRLGLRLGPSRDRDWIIANIRAALGQQEEQ